MDSIYSVILRHVRSEGILESTTRSARSFHTTPRPHAILSILLWDDSNIWGATRSVLNIQSPSARPYNFARRKGLRRFIGVEGWSILHLTYGILPENLGPTGCAVFSHQGAGRWLPRHTACLGGSKLFSSQKHERSRMHKGVISWAEEEVRTSIYPKTEEDDERSYFPQAHFWAEGAGNHSWELRPSTLV